MLKFLADLHPPSKLSLRELTLTLSRTKRCYLFTILWSHFDHCNVVWGNCNKTLANKLQKLLNRAARFLTSSTFETSTEYLFQVLSWRSLNLSVRYKKLAWYINLWIDSHPVIFDLDLLSVAPLLIFLFATLKIILLFPYPAPTFLRTVSDIVARCYGTGCQLMCGRLGL